MGRARIISDLGGGEYTVEIEHDTTTADAIIAQIDVMIADTQARLSGAVDPAKTALEARILSLQKRRDMVEAASDQDYQIDLWCADLTTGLSGTVGVIEVGTDRDLGMNIRPGQAPADSGPSFSLFRDGQNTPFLTMTTADAIHNFCLMPAIQKYRPTYRYATISDIDAGEDTCTITLEACVNNKFSQSINLNLAETYNDVPVEYMTCNSAAFSDGDAVLVEFADYMGEGSGNPDPKVIGFKEEPKPCGGLYLVFFVNRHRTSVNQYVIWDLENSQWPDDPLLEGVSWPATYAEVEDFLDRLSLVDGDDAPQSVWSTNGAEGEDADDTDITYGTGASVECDTGYEFQGNSDYDRYGTYVNYYWRSHTCYEAPTIEGWIFDCEYYEGAPPYDMTIQRYWAAMNDVGEPVSGDGEETYNRQSFYYYNRMDTGPTEVESRLEYLDESISEGRYDISVGWCKLTGEHETNGTYTRHTPIGEMDALGKYTYSRCDPCHDLAPDLENEYKELAWYDYDERTLFNNSAVSQIFSQLVIVRHTTYESDGAFYGSSTKTLDQFEIGVNVLAGADFYEDGTGDVNPATQARRLGLEAAMEAAFQNIFDEEAFDANNIYRWCSRLQTWTIGFYR